MIDMIIDTHSHLYQEVYQPDLEEVIATAKLEGVSHIFLPNVDVDSIPQMLALAEQYPNYCIPMMGLHPTSVDANFRSQLAVMEEELSKRDYCAIGEIGMDLYWDKTYLAEQKEAFAIQISWAKARQIPIAVHVRDSFNETMEVLLPLADRNLKGVFHSFCGTKEHALEMLKLENFFFGISGIVTFKNSDLSETLKSIPLNRLVLETDSPYLTPTPHRGKRNHPIYLKYIAQKLADIYNVSVEEVMAVTTANAKELFAKAFE